MADEEKTYDKPALSLDGQIEKYTARGLQIPEPERAKHYLRFIGYYRFTTYAQPFYTPGYDPVSPTFVDGTTFDDVLNLYVFDRKLRLLAMDAIERIEVAIRAVTSNTLSIKYGPHWFIDADVYRSKVDQARLVTKIANTVRSDSRWSKQRVQHIQEYYETYDAPELPPSWMIMEELAFGMVSQMLKSLNREEQKSIASEFNLNPKVMVSWFHSISHLRNLCAHHSRIWNRVFTIKPIAGELSELMERNDKFYTQALIIQHLMGVVADRSTWAERLAALLEEYPSVNILDMGFPADWDSQMFWELKT